MKLLYYIIALDIAILIIAIKLIFGSYTIFAKSLTDHFYPDDVLPNPLEQFAEENDSRHKINIVYAVLLVLAGLTVLVEIFVLN